MDANLLEERKNNACKALLYPYTGGRVQNLEDRRKAWGKGGH